MRRYRLNGLAFLLLSLALFAFVFEARGDVAVAQAPVVSNVQFAQVEWFGSQAPAIPDSEWGEFSADITPGLSVEYVNVVANAGGSDQWIVPNLPTVPAAAEAYTYTVATTFDLGLLGVTRGDDINSLYYFLTVSPVPLTSPPAGPMGAAAVGDVTYDAEGRPDGPLTEPGAPPDLSVLDFSPGPFSFAWQPGLPNVDLDRPDDVNGCGPAAAANSVKWLGVADALRKIYEDMNRAMGRVAGKPIGDDAFLAGKLKYAKDKKFGVVVKFQDDELGGADFTTPDGTATAKGTKPTFDFIEKELDAKEDVELGMTFYRCLRCAKDGNGDTIDDIDAGAKCKAHTDCDALVQGDQLGSCKPLGPECITDADCDAGTSACSASGGHWVTLAGKIGLGSVQGVWSKDDKDQDKPGGTRLKAGWLIKRPDGFLELTGFARNKVDIVVSESPFVGGTTEFIAGASDASARPAGGSGPSVPYAAFAGVAAAAALALTAGGWFARRRWLR